MGYRVAIVGATGLVGQEFIKTLEQRNFPMDSVKLCASDRSAGKKMMVKGKEYEVQTTTEDSFHDIDIALFSAGAGTSLKFSPIAAASGAVVVDNSSAFRMEDYVPLVVPEVNPEDIKWHKGIIANPNCSTIQMVVALAPLHRINPIKRLVVSTYQAVSGAGIKAVNELTEQTKTALSGGKPESNVFSHQIAFNALPEIDIFFDNGYTKEEWKMEVETKKIMHAPEIAVSTTCVRIPVYKSHSEAVNVEFTRPMPPQEAREILNSSPGVKVIDDVKNHLYPLATDAAGTDDTYVGRIRSDTSCPNGLVMWIVSDNIRKGAALNAVQIAEEMIQRGWVNPGG